MNDRRIWLSPPHLVGDEIEFLSKALESNLIAPGGPFVGELERAVAEYVGVDSALAVSSGTAALHLALEVLGVGPGDVVICPTFTYVATANPIRYVGAEPCFVDCDPDYWQMDPESMSRAVEACVERGQRPKAVIAVDLYGQTADYGRIVPVCDSYGIPLIEDAAQALGATCNGAGAGSFGRVGVLSFNGNKIITASGGGMLVSNDCDLLARARGLANQASDPGRRYYHSGVGFNYGFSNLLAALGCAQLRVLESRIATLTQNHALYREALENMPGVQFLPEAPHGRSTHWLNCLRIDPEQFGASRDQVIDDFARQNIDARPVWVPLHRQEMFSRFRCDGGTVAESIASDGLCLPSGSNLSQDELMRILSVIQQCASLHERSDPGQLRPEVL